MTKLYKFLTYTKIRKNIIDNFGRTCNNDMQPYNEFIASLKDDIDGVNKIGSGDYVESPHFWNTVLCSDYNGLINVYLRDLVNTLIEHHKFKNILTLLEDM